MEHEEFITEDMTLEKGTVWGLGEHHGLLLEVLASIYFF